MLIFPGMTAFIMQLNAMKMLVLSPFNFQKHFSNLLRLFINFSEADLLSKAINKGKFFYSDEYLMMKHFTPKNENFKFVSVYPRMRGLRIILRILINLLFFFFSKKLKESIIAKNNAIKEIQESIKRDNIDLNEVTINSKIQLKESKKPIPQKMGSQKLTLLLQSKRQLKRYRFLMKYLLRIIMSLDYVNMLSNILLLSTSLRKGVSVFDFCVIFIDFINLAYFQIILVTIYFKHRGKATNKIKDIQQREIVLDFAFSQNGTCLKLPITVLFNLTEIMRILIFIALRFNKVLFGVVFTSFNIFTVALLVRKWIYQRLYFSQKLFAVILITMLTETLLHTSLGIYAIFEDYLKENYFFECWTLILFILWVLFALSLAVVNFIFPKHRKIYNLSISRRDSASKYAIAIMKCSPSPNKIKNVKLKIQTRKVKNSPIITQKYQLQLPSSPQSFLSTVGKVDSPLLTPMTPTTKGSTPTHQNSSFKPEMRGDLRQYSPFTRSPGVKLGSRRSSIRANYMNRLLKYTNKSRSFSRVHPEVKSTFRYEKQKKSLFHPSEIKIQQELRNGKVDLNKSMFVESSKVNFINVHNSKRKGKRNRLQSEEIVVNFNSNSKEVK